ncbi:MAG: phospholipase [Pirellulales bacterium]|nr:phospholipase [Pirellulales bacterium]
MSSQTNAVTETLRALHRVHGQVTDLEGRLRRGPQVVRAHEANVARCEANLARLQEEAKKARMASDAKQSQLKGGEEKVAKLRVQLNTASSNREYQALKDQIAAAEMANSVLSDEILEGLERLDGFAAQIDEAKQTLAKAQAEREKVARQVEAEAPSIRDDLAVAQGNLKEAESALPDDFRPLYNRAVQAFGQEALAPVVGEYCGGCNQKVPLNAIAALLLTVPKPLVCRSCGRMLYVPEDWRQR